MAHPQRSLALRWSLLVAVAAVVGCGTDLDVVDADDAVVVVASSDESALRANRDPDRLVVYSNNIENMLFDWKDLVYEMERQPLRPDIVLVQQLSGRDEMERLIRFMERRLGDHYDGVVAQDFPDDHRWGGEVLPRPMVTTGIIYRRARFEVKGSDRWMPFGRGFKNQPKTCGERSNNSGYQTLRVKLHDTIANKDVVAVSLRHWTWHACSEKNLKRIVEGEDNAGTNTHAGLGSKAALHIVGGDFNDRIFDGDGGYACWYRQMNRDVGARGCEDAPGGAVDYGFTDPLFVACDGDKACMRRRAGIDSLFVRRSDGRRARADHFDIVSFDDGNRANRAITGGDGLSNRKGRDGYNDVASRYSGHMARKSYVYY